MATVQEAAAKLLAAETQTCSRMPPMIVPATVVSPPTGIVPVNPFGQTVPLLVTQPGVTTLTQPTSFGRPPISQPYSAFGQSYPGTQPPPGFGQPTTPFGQGVPPNRPLPVTQIPPNRPPPPVTQIPVNRPPPTIDQVSGLETTTTALVQPPTLPPQTDQTWNRPQKNLLGKSAADIEREIKALPWTPDGIRALDLALAPIASTLQDVKARASYYVGKTKLDFRTPTPVNSYDVYWALSHHSRASQMAIPAFPFAKLETPSIPFTDVVKPSFLYNVSPGLLDGINDYLSSYISQFPTMTPDQIEARLVQYDSNCAPNDELKALQSRLQLPFGPRQWILTWTIMNRIYKAVENRIREADRLNARRNLPPLERFTFFDLLEILKLQ
jgi:hypothetical protein